MFIGEMNLGHHQGKSSSYNILYNIYRDNIKFIIYRLVSVDDILSHTIDSILNHYVCQFLVQIPLVLL